MTRTIQTNQSLAGEVALVTGAGTGIGRAAALAFAAEGAAVVLAGRRLPELEAVAKQIVLSGGRAYAMSADVTDEDSVAALVASTVKHFGRLDMAFNNAGVSSYGLIETLSSNEFDHVMSTNVKGVWMLVKHEVAAMRALGNGGAIVNTSSIAATGGTAGLSIYAASKGALDSMIRAVALEVGSAGIRINNVSPGFVLTPMTEGMPQPMLDAIAEHTALKSNATPSDIANAAVWLAGQGARFITGQSIVVDGGFNIAGQR
jgi:NAD(P)-dependent dehydrogenase (short-subunit alcohol dehydrogenase family)